MSKIELSLTRIAALPGSLLAAPLFEDSLGRERVGGLPQSTSVRIKAPPPTVHSLLDPTATFNRWRIRNEVMDLVDARSGRYRHITAGMGDRAFEVHVTRSAPPSVIETTCYAEDRRPFGAVFSSSSAYKIEPTDSGGSFVTLMETTIFIAGMPPFHLARHALIMLMSMRMDLLRLKHEAETGRDADAKAA